MSDDDDVVVQTSRSVSALRSEMQPLVHAFLAACEAAGLDILITCTTRSLEDQAELYSHGRDGRNLSIVTNAKPGESAHNYGLALDVVPMVAGKPDWDGKHPIWAQVGQLGEAAGLEWAGAPTYPFHELPHFQLPNWRAVAGI